MIVGHCIKLLRESQLLLSNRCSLSFSPQFIRRCRLCVCACVTCCSVLQCAPVSSAANPSSVRAANQIRTVIVAGLSSNYWLLTCATGFSCCGLLSCYLKWLMEQFCKPSKYSGVNVFMASRVSCAVNGWWHPKDPSHYIYFYFLFLHIIYSECMQSWDSLGHLESLTVNCSSEYIFWQAPAYHILLLSVP